MYSSSLIPTILGFFPSSPEIALLYVRQLSGFKMSLRYAMSSIRSPSATSKVRLSQVQRHFSATTSARQEIQDAYILSASRTPTAKVGSCAFSSVSLVLIEISSMDLSLPFPPPNSAPSLSNLPSRNLKFPSQRSQMSTWAMSFKAPSARRQLDKQQSSLAYQPLLRLLQ